MPILHHAFKIKDVSYLLWHFGDHHHSDNSMIIVDSSLEIIAGQCVLWNLHDQSNTNDFFFVLHPALEIIGCGLFIVSPWQLLLC